MNPDGSDLMWVTNNGVADFGPALSRDGKGKIVFDSNQTAIALGAPATTTNSDLFLINADGTSDTDLLPTPLTRGSSATWSPDSKRIAYHRSRSGTYGQRVFARGELGGPTRDSDIFVANVDDLIEHGVEPTNITEYLGAQSDDDADWSPDGSRFAFTSRPSDCANGPACRAAAELWVMNADGTNAAPITSNTLEERSPDWRPDGSKILFMCRFGDATPFEICVTNPDGTGLEVLTNNTVPDLTSSWSPDGTRIAFLRGTNGTEQIWVMNYLADENGDRNEVQITFPPGINLFPNWSTIAVGCRSL